MSRIKIRTEVGMKYGHLTILKELLPIKYPSSSGILRRFKCQCDCGTIIEKDDKWIKKWQGCSNCRNSQDLNPTSMEGEIWKDIQGYEGLYQISNLGRVKSLPRYRNCIHPYTTSEKILQPRAVGKGKYAAVVLHDLSNNKKQQCKVHRLVAEAFVPNPDGFAEVNHKDEDKWNNKANNLEWCSRAYNINYGSANANRRLHFIKAVEMLDDNGNALMKFDSRVAAARYVGVDGSNIARAIKFGRMSGGYYWRDKQ